MSRLGRSAFRNRVKRVISGGLRSNSDGGALVEMAFALPIMMLMITGMTGFGILLNNYLVLSHAVDVGARALSVSRGVSTTPCVDAQTAIQNAAPSLGTSSLTISFVINGTTYAGSNISGSGSGGCSSSTNTDMSAGNTAVVTGTYPFLLSVYGWTPTSWTLKAQTAEIIQ
jgi:Flp pilus assembly protein TadG